MRTPTSSRSSSLSKALSIGTPTGPGVPRPGKSVLQSTRTTYVGPRGKGGETVVVVVVVVVVVFLEGSASLGIPRTRKKIKTIFLEVSASLGTPRGVASHLIGLAPH